MRNSAVASFTPESDEPLLPRKVENVEGYRPIVAFVFTVNFIVGAGVLGLPYGFAEGGVATGIAFILMIIIVASISMGWLVEVQGRACGLQKLRALRASQGRSIQAADITEDDFQITQLQGEVNGLCELFISPRARLIYDIALYLFTFGALWVYTIVFASSLVNALGISGITDGLTCDLYDEDTDFDPKCNDAYMIYVVIFAVLMAFMSTRELSKQVVFQMTLTAVAIFALLVMIGTVFDAWVRGDYYDTDKQTEPKGDGPFTADFDWFNANGMATLFGAAVFSQNAHHGYFPSFFFFFFYFFPPLIYFYFYFFFFVIIIPPQCSWNHKTL